MAHILNQYFDKIYCLTGHDFYDRHEHAKKHLNGIDFQWVVSFPSVRIAPSPPITETEISTLYGHLFCIWNAKLHGYKKIAIFEDDVVFNVTEEEMKPFFAEVPDNWDFLHMSNPSHAVGIWDWQEWATPYSEHANKIIWGNGSSFIGIQSHMFDKVIEWSEKCSEPVDFGYFRLFKKGQNTYSPSPKFFCDTISTPHESIRDRFPTEGFLPSRIKHYK